MSQVELEKLERAGDRVPEEELSPEMACLLASHRDCAAAKPLLSGAAECGPEGVIYQGLLLFLRASSLSIQAIDAALEGRELVPNILKLAGAHGLLEERTGGEMKVAHWPPSLFSADPALQPDCHMVALAAGAALGLTPNKEGAVTLLSHGIDALWPGDASPQVAHRLEAQGWVPQRSTALELPVGQGESPAAAALAAKLRQSKARAGNCGIEDVHEWALTARVACSMALLQEQIEDSSQPEAQALIKRLLRDCSLLMRRGAVATCFAYKMGLQALQLGCWGHSPDSELQCYLDAIEFAKENKCWMGAAEMALMLGLWCASFVETQRPGPPAALQELLRDLPLIIDDVRVMEGRLKPWVPALRMRALTHTRRGLEGVLAELRASGSIKQEQLDGAPAPDQVHTCDSCGRQALEMKRCSACQTTRYCSRTCQALHWRQGHKKECAALAAKQQAQPADG